MTKEAEIQTRRVHRGTARTNEERLTEGLQRFVRSHFFATILGISLTGFPAKAGPSAQQSESGDLG